MNRSRRWSSILALATAGAAITTFPTCRSTKHTVARIVTPAARPTEVFVPAPAEPPPPPATRAPLGSPTPVPSPTPTVVAMPVVTAPAAPAERSPGVLYEQLLPTPLAVTPVSTPVPTPRSTRVPRPTQTPRPGPAQKPGAYYEDEEGRPLPTPTPGS
jgi:hypothetical protein